MAWNALRAYPEQRLTKIKGWQAKGLTYWENRLRICQERVRIADCSSQLGRAIADREVAEAAIYQLKEK